MEEVRAWNPFATDDATAAAETSGTGDVPVTADPGDEVELTADVVTEIQTRLSDLGYEPGPTDGVMGPKTRGAIRRYQVVAGLPVDGRVTEPFLASLNGAADSSEPAQSNEPEETVQDQSPAESPAALSEPVPALAPAGIVVGPSPAYRVGSRYVYDNGEVRTVLDVDGDQVLWLSNTGAQSTAHRNFMIPALSWGSSDVSGKRTLDSSPDGIWPRRDGQSVTFSTTAVEEQRARPNRRSQISEVWHCRVEDEARLSLRAGEFDTQRIVCDGRSEPDGAERQRVWHYVPAIAHYVVFEETADTEPDDGRRNELLAIVPDTSDWPPAARAGLGWAIEHALETSAPGEATRWTSSAIDTEVTITPGPRAATGDHGICRSFVQTWSLPHGVHAYPAQFCRDDAGHWTIPVPEAGVEVAKGVQ